ncbi:unnamed protein product [Toxocara canis]|uniref:Uma2 domain-containing protein n=1 Tax=Toxocara canis TaxID=6265 RepID=A0A183V646_TOXCA|nr:unnamed protein product [Toxocara canis]
MYNTDSTRHYLSVQQISVMESYVKNEEVLIDCPPPFPSELIDGVNVMVVKEGTKFRNILGHVEKQFKVKFCLNVSAL